MDTTAPIIRRVAARLRASAQRPWHMCQGLMKRYFLQSRRIKGFRKMSPLKLNVGCGQVRLAGWVNIDIDGSADLVLDVRERLPFDDGTVDFIYSEHLLEHLTYEEGGRFLRECFRCLKKDGVSRIATPDLDYVCHKYDHDWANQDWLSWPGFEFIKTRGKMINVAFRYWGHQYLYNEEDLRQQLTEAGFSNARRCALNTSAHPELLGLETRKDSLLIMEAVKE